jgi:signal transduction histidine kinase
VTRRLRARWQERLAERERIFRELHDTFLQSTFALSLKVESVIASIPEDHPARNGLQQALDRADEVVAEGRKRVHDLRAVETSAQHLGAALAVNVSVPAHLAYNREQGDLSRPSGRLGNAPSRPSTICLQ